MTPEELAAALDAMTFEQKLETAVAARTMADIAHGAKATALNEIADSIEDDLIKGWWNFDE